MAMLNALSSYLMIVFFFDEFSPSIQFRNLKETSWYENILRKLKNPEKFDAWSIKFNKLTKFTKFYTKFVSPTHQLFLPVKPS